MIEDSGDFTTLLRAYMAQAVRANRDLAALTGISVRTIEKWTGGVIRRPRFASDVLKVARALLLDAHDTSALLQAAGHPPLAALQAQASQTCDAELAALLASWSAPQASVPDAPAGGEIRAGSAMKHQLRPPVADFIGREQEIAELVAALQAAVTQGDGAIIAGVHGMGGIGKTELAYRVAHQLRDAFPDAQIVVELGGSSAAPLTLEETVQAVIRAIAPDEKLPQKLPDLELLYRTMLHDQRALILADDACDAAQVRPLIPPTGSALLITSRQRFTLPGMTRIDLEQLQEETAVALLRGICERVSLDDAHTIARACGYLPLALRISGGILANDPALAVASYIQRLADERKCLLQLRDPDDPQLNVATSLALSYALLDTGTQRVFRQLGIVAADFATPLAQALVTAPADVEVEATLHLLLRRNMVMYDERQERWRLHDLVRALAWRELEDTGELTATAWRYAQAAVNLAQKIQDMYLAGGDDVLKALAQFDAERPHIDVARRWAAMHAGTSRADRLLVADAVATYYIGDLRYDRRQERIPQLARALAAARRLDDSCAERQILNSLGIAHIDIGETRQAISFYEQARIVAQTIGDLRGEGQAFNNLGIAYVDLGKAKQAIPYYEQARSIARELSNRRSEGYALGNLGIAYGLLGNHQQAIEYFEQNLAITCELGDKHGEGVSLLNLGESALMLGDVRRAYDCCVAALDIARVVEDRQMEGCTLAALGRTFVVQGENLRAIGAFEQALTILRAIGDRRAEAECSWHFGLALAQQGEREAALPLLRACVAYEQTIDHTNAAAHAALLTEIEVGRSR